MAQIDSAIPTKWVGAGSLVLEEGGGNTVTMTFEQGTFSWEEKGREYVEAMARGRHAGTPVLIETTDNNVSGSFQFIPTSFYGNANVYPYEMMLFKGGAAAYTTVAAGSKKALKATLTISKSEESEATQTAIFAYCTFTESVDMGGQDGMSLIDVSFMDHENSPTVS